jgi:DNA-binding transcriptional ArsR family regulator
MQIAKRPVMANEPDTRRLSELKGLRTVQADVCKAFGNPKRLLILEAIWDGEATYENLLELTGLDKPTLTQHTAFMRRKGILASSHYDRVLHFSIANPKVLAAFKLMREVIIERIQKEAALIDSETG